MEFTYETELAYQGTEYYAEVFIDVTNVVVVKPDPTTWDSDEDYFGTKEMEFTINFIFLYESDEGCFVHEIDNKKQIEELDIDYDKIEARLWEQLEAMNEDGYEG